MELGYVRSTGRKRGGLTVWEPVPARNVGTVAHPSRRPTGDDGVRTSTSKRTWTAEEAELINWFLASLDTMPTDTFRLYSGVNVVNPSKFFTVLERDCKVGPNGPRARTGAITSDLKKLRDLFG